MPNVSDSGQEGEETPWIVIPYWIGDLGRKTLERPLPPTPTPGSAVVTGILSYACSSIEVIGGAPGIFTPGAPTTVAVTVRNYGKGAGLDLVKLRLWWSAPTTEFGNLTKKPPMAQAVATLARDGLASRPPLVQNMTFTTPSDIAVPHICVVVLATVLSDGIPVWPADPTGDRHWAQRNLHTISADSSGKFHISFSSGNAADRDLPFLIRASQVSGPAMELLAREARANPRKVELVSSAIRPLLVVRRPGNEKPGTVDAQIETAVTIRAKRQLTMVFEGQLKQPLGPGEFTAFEVVQINAPEARGPKQKGDVASKPNRVGSIGVIVFGAA